MSRFRVDGKCSNVEILGWVVTHSKLSLNILVHVDVELLERFAVLPVLVLALLRLLLELNIEAVIAREVNLTGVLSRGGGVHGVEGGGLQYIAAGPTMVT